MAGFVEQVVVSVTADTSAATKAVAQADAQMSANLRNTQKETKNASDGFTVMKGVVAGVVSNLATKAFSMAASGLNSIWQGAQATGASLSTLKTVLGTLNLGQYYGQWSKFSQAYAAQTVFSTEDITNAIGQLAAAGKIAPAGMQPLIKGLGGLAAATADPKNAMNALLYVMPQISSAGKLQAQDWNQVRNAIGGMSAPIKNYIMSKDGITDWNKAMADGKISAQMVNDAITAVGNNDGLQKMSTTPKTVGQAFDGLQESISNALQDPSNKINQILVPAIGKLADKISSTDWSFLAKGLDAALKIAGDPAFQMFAVGIAAAATAMWLLNAAQTVYNILAATGSALTGGLVFVLLALVAAVVWFFTQTTAGQAIARDIGTAFQQAFLVVQGVFEQAGIIVGQFVNIVGGFIGGMVNVVVGYFRFVWNFWATVVNGIVGAARIYFGIVGAVVNGVVNGIVGYFRWLAGAVGGIMGGIGGSVSGAFNFILRGVQSGINGVVNFFKGLINSVISGVNGAIGVINHIPGVHIGMIPKFARGGIVAGAGTGTSDSVPAMLSAGEYVVRAQAVRAIGVNNLDALNRGDMRGAGGNYSVVVNAPQQADPVWLGHEIGRQVSLMTTAAAGVA